MRIAIVLACFLSLGFVVYEIVYVAVRIAKSLQEARGSGAKNSESVARALNVYSLLPEDMARIKIVIGAVLFWAVLWLIHAQWSRHQGFAPVTAVMGTILIAASAFVTFRLPDRILSFLYGRYLEKMNRQLIDAMSVMSISLRSGKTPIESIEAVAAHGPDPIRGAFGQAFQEIQNGGVPFDLAMKRLAERLPFKDMRIFVSMLAIARQTGGSYAAVLDRSAHTIRERFRLREKCWALSSDGRFMAIGIALAPLANLLFFLAVDQGRLLQFIEHPVGCLALASIALMDYFGYLWIKKIIDVQF